MGGFNGRHANIPGLAVGSNRIARAWLGAWIALLRAGPKKQKPRQLIIAFSPGTVAENAIADAALSRKFRRTTIKTVETIEKYNVFE